MEKESKQEKMARNIQKWRDQGERDYKAWKVEKETEAYKKKQLRYANRLSPN